MNIDNELTNKRGCFLTRNIDAGMIDLGIAEAMYNFFIQNRAKEIIDLGCGLGQYVRFLNEKNIKCTGFDGNPLTKTLTNGDCETLDLTFECSFNNKSDWTICLEVAEHIPKKYESVFLKNLVNSTNKGIILSWATKGQGGTHHANCQDNSYVKNLLEKQGLINDLSAENLLRQSISKLNWFKKSLMVFEKTQ